MRSLGCGPGTAVEENNKGLLVMIEGVCLLVLPCEVVSVVEWVW